MRYNYALPHEDPNHCFRLRPFVASIAVAGMALDGLTWYMPHRVVWNLKLDVSHKLAISFMFGLGLFNIVIGGLCTDSLPKAASKRDITYFMGESLMWAVAQISTGIMVNCCPLLRPLFDRLLPHRIVFANQRPKATSKNTRSLRSPDDCQTTAAPLADENASASITVTTNIAIRNGTRLPQPLEEARGGQMGPTFDVEKGPAGYAKCRGYSRVGGCGCCGEADNS